MDKDSDVNRDDGDDGRDGDDNRKEGEDGEVGNEQALKDTARAQARSIEILKAKLAKSNKMQNRQKEQNNALRVAIAAKPPAKKHGMPPKDESRFKKQKLLPNVKEVNDALD